MGNAVLDRQLFLAELRQDVCNLGFQSDRAFLNQLENAGRRDEHLGYRRQIVDRVQTIRFFFRD